MPLRFKKKRQQGRGFSGKCLAGFLACGVFVALVVLAPSPRSELHRTGEAFISDEVFFSCVSRLLERKNRTYAIPLLVVPVTLEYADMKQFFCNISVPVERIVIINSGVYPLLKRALEQLEALTKASETVFVSYHPENIGYAASVNVGLRMALALGHDRVPFVFVSNSDVRFRGSVLEDLVKETHLQTVSDSLRLRNLQAEVEKDEADLLSGGANHSVSVWNGHCDTGTVVTSKWLPARIRRMQGRDVGSAFASHCALFFPQPSIDMCSFFVTHLALATVGLLDENYYPAYGEDYDFLFRAANLGFRTYTSAPGRSIHFGNANLMKSPLFHREAFMQHKDVSLQLCKFNRMNYEYMRIEYRKHKWFPHSRVFNDKRENHSLFPFGGRMPIDAWVKDTMRIESIRRIGDGALCRKDYLKYNLSLLDGVL